VEDAPGKLSDEDFARIGNVMDDLSQVKIFIDDSSVNGIVELRTKARRLKAQHGLDVSHCRLLADDEYRQADVSVNRVQEISELRVPSKISLVNFTFP